MHTPPLVLLVDDDPQIQDLFTTKLKASGFGVVQARNGEEGIATAKQEQPDVILLDVLMPVMDGAQTLLALKNEPTTKDIPVYILTSLQDKEDDIKYAKEVGAVDFLNKDIEFKDLVQKLHDVLKA